MQQIFDALRKAAVEQLPEQIDDNSDPTFAVCRELIEAGYMEAVDASTMGHRCYLNPRITLAGREYLEAMGSSTESLRVFISHSSEDRVFVSHLIELLRTALALKSKDIRCTSVDGYRLPGGADTTQQLKQEIHEAESFVGVISPNSLRSSYVLFELGARWGAGNPMFPLLVPGSDPSIIPSPLNALNALEAGSSAQLHQLITDLASHLKIAAEPPSTFNAQLLSVAKFEIPETREGRTKKSPGKMNRSLGDQGGRLHEELEAIIRILCADHGQSRTAAQIGSLVEMKQVRVKYRIDQLVEKGMLNDLLSVNADPRYELNEVGRAYAIENDLC